MKPIYYCIFILLLSACSYGSKVNQSAKETTDQMANVSFNEKGVADPASVQKQIILMTGRLEILTANYAESTRQLKKLISEYEIMVQEQKEDIDAYSVKGIYTLRVASNKIVALMDSLKHLGIECSQNELKSEDLTAEYTDTEVRLRTKRAIYEQYLSLIKQAKNVDEVLKVQESARVLREEIESMEGRLQYLNNHASYSTIYLSLYENKTSASLADSFWSRVERQFIHGNDLMQNFILFFVTLWPFLILILVVIFARGKIKRFFAGVWKKRISA